MCGIFHHRQLMQLSQRQQAIHLAGMPIQVYRHHGLGARGDGSLDLRWIECTAERHAVGAFACAAMPAPAPVIA